MCHIFFLFSTANKKIMSNESNVAKASEAMSATTAEGAAAATSTSIWTLETIVRNFDTIPGRLDQGKWLVVTAKISSVFQIIGFKSLGEVLGGADLSAAALVVGPWLKKHPHVRLPVASYGGLNAYKADKTESYGTHAVYIFFGKRRRNMLLTNIHPLPRQRAAATVAAAVEAAAPVAVAATAVAVAAAGGAAVRAAAAQGVVVCDAKTTLCSFLTRWATRRLTELSRRSLRGSRSMAVVEPGERMRCATMAQLGWGGGGGLAAKRQSLDRRLVSHAELLAELEEKQAKFAEEVEKAGLQEKLDAKKIKRLSDSAESLKREVGKVKEKEKAPAAIEAAARRGAAKPGQTTKKLRSLEATTASGEKAAIQKL